MPRLNPLSKREYIKRVRNLGLEVDEARGKGGEWIVLDPRSNQSLPMPHLAPGDDVLTPYILATMRRFNITREQWIKAAKTKVQMKR